MRIENRDLLISMSGPGRCELCGRWCRDREAHHHRRRGIGSGSRLDIAINLCSLGSALKGGCGCHFRVENNRQLDNEVALVIARREGHRREDIADVIAGLLQVELEAPDELLDERASVMTPDGRKLFMQIIMAERERKGIVVGE